MGNGYGDFINDQYKKDKKPKVYKTTGSQYNKTEVKERAEIRSQLANDVAYWEQKRGKKSDRQKDHVAIAENYYKTQERRKEVDKAGQKRMSENKGKGKYSQDDRLQAYKDNRDKNRKSESKEYEKRIGEFATSDFKKQNNYGANKGLVESDVRFRSYMDKQKGKKDSVAQSLIPEFLPKKKKEKSFLDKIFDTVKGDKPSSPASLNLSVRDGGSNKPKGKLGDSLQKSSDSVGKFNSNAVNKATGSLWENSILPMMEAFDDKDKKPSEKLKDLFTGNLGDGKEREYELAKPDSKGAKLASDLLGYGLGGAGVGKALRTVGLGANTSAKALSAKGAFERGKEGAAIGALMSGAEVGSREVGRPDDYNWKQNLAQVGIETAGGAILDPLLAAGGSKLLSKLGQKPKGKVDFDDVAELESSELPFTMNEPQPTVKPMQQTVERMAATTSKPRHDVDTLMKSYKGQNVNSIPIQPRQSKPMPNEPLERKLPYWRNKNNPIDEQDVADIYRHVQEVESKMIKLKDPNNPEYQKIVNDHSKRDPNFNTKRIELDKRRSVLEDVMNREQEWKSVKESQEAFATKNRPEEMKFIVPIDERLDYEAVPKRFRGSNNTASMDIHEAASVAGYDSIDEYVKYLQSVDNLLSKTRKDFKLPPSKQVATLVQNESRLAKDVDNVISKITNRRADESLIEELSSLMTPRKGAAFSNVPVKRIEQSMDPKDVDALFNVGSKKPKGLDKPIREVDYTKDIELEALKDITGFKGATNDVYRIFDQVFGKDAKVSKRILGELDASKSRYVNMQENLLKELDEKIVKGLGIKKGGKLSKYVQDYGEKNMDLPTLMAKAPKDWEKVVKADEWFRAKYDSLIDEVNSSRALVYPGNKEKQIPKRKDYYRHFTEFTGLTGLKNIFDTPGPIDPHLAGTSEFTKPRTKWAGFMQQRGMGPYKSDAVGGFLNYIPSASYAKEIDPNIINFRGLGNEIADLTTDTKNLNNFKEFLGDYANDLAGKTNPFMDRFVQKYVPGGRQSMAALSWVNSRVKTNTILGNLGSTLAQLANVPLGVSFAKQHSVKGLGRTLKAVLDNSEPIHQSPFMKERYSQSLYRKFDQRLIDQPQKMAEWLIENSDRAGSSFVWNAAYEKGLKQGIQNPIKFADENTRRLIAGRGVGEVPLAQKSKVVQMVMPFTLEVGNLWRVMNDMGKAKDFGGIALLFASNFALNKVMEEIRGNPVTFDPIDALREAYEDDLSPLETGGRLAGEVLSNVPAGQFLAGAYPEYGEIGSFKGPTREKLFGERNPQRFGTGLVAAGGLSDPLFKLLPPFGGNQLKKTLEGMEVLKDGGSYKEGKGVLSGLPFKGEQNELNFPVERNLKNTAQMAMFGPYSTGEAREYFDEERRPLGEKQTAQYKLSEARGKGKEFYDSLILDRRDATIKRKIKEINEDETLTDKQRKEGIQKVLNQHEGK